MGERREDNFVIWDLVHGVDVSVKGIIQNIAQRVRVSSMREDFRGLTSLHVLALQGRIEVINESGMPLLEKVGGRGLLHFMALGGHIRHDAVLRYVELSRESLSDDLDEYNGSALDIQNFVEEKMDPPIFSVGRIRLDVISKVDLLKIWLMIRPCETFLKQMEECRKFEQKIGLEVFASEEIYQFHQICSYLGTIFSYDMLPFLEKDLKINSDVSSYFPKTETPIIFDMSESQSFDASKVSPSLDESIFFKTSQFINNGMPNIFVFNSLGVKGFPVVFRYAPLKPVLEEEVSKDPIHDKINMDKWRIFWIYKVLKETKQIMARKLIEGFSCNTPNYKENVDKLNLFLQPKMLFKQLKNKEENPARLRDIYFELRRNFIFSPIVSLYMELMEIFLGMPELNIELIIKNWIEVALIFAESREENYEITLYLLVEIFKLIMSHISDVEFLRSNSVEMEWKDPDNKLIGIQLKIKSHI